MAENEIYKQAIGYVEVITSKILQLPP